MSDCLKSINNTIKTKIVVEISHAMNFIHNHGLIHRDLKIDSIKLNSIFEAKIVDFNLTKIYEWSDNSSSFEESMTKKVGTLAFMSPEMLNEKNYDYKTDVYSFGVVMYYIFIGSFPKKIDGVNIKIPEPSQSASKCCIDIISLCLMNDPSKRPSFEEILKQIRDSSYSLAPYVDKQIVAKRDLELQNFNIK